MTGAQLLQALLDQAGVNPHALARTLKLPSLQSTMSKFMTGAAREPRRASLQPLADHFGIPVDAFYDEAQADRIAADRGLMTARREAPPNAAPDQLEQALRTLSTLLQATSPHKREHVALSLQTLARQPELVEEITGDIRRLLDIVSRPTSKVLQTVLPEEQIAISNNVRPHGTDLRVSDRSKAK